MRPSTTPSSPDSYVHSACGPNTFISNTWPAHEFRLRAICRFSARMARKDALRCGPHTLHTEIWPAAKRLFKTNKNCPIDKTEIVNGAVSEPAVSFTGGSNCSAILRNKLCFRVSVKPQEDQRRDSPQCSVRFLRTHLRFRGL